MAAVAFFESIKNSGRMLINRAKSAKEFSFQSKIILIPSQRMITLQEGNVILRSISPSEIPNLFALIQDDLGLAEQMTWECPQTLQEAEAIFEKIFDDERICFGIYLKERLIGLSNIQNFHWWHHDAQKASAFVNFWVGTEFLENDYEVDALRGICHYGFESLKLKKLFVGCFEGNESVHKAATKVGFRKIGTLKKHFLKQNKPIDSSRYELLPQDFVG